MGRAFIEYLLCAKRCLQGVCTQALSGGRPSSARTLGAVLGTVPSLSHPSLTFIKHFHLCVHNLIVSAWHPYKVGGTLQGSI